MYQDVSVLLQCHVFPIKQKVLKMHKFKFRLAVNVSLK